MRGIILREDKISVKDIEKEPAAKTTCLHEKK